MKDKNSRDISRDVWNFSRYLKKKFWFIPRFLAEPQLCSAEPWLGYTVKFVKVFHDKIDAASLSTGYAVADGGVSETMLGVGKYI